MDTLAQVRAALHDEVVTLHHFLVRLFTGYPFPDPTATIDTVLERFREDFVYIYPGGVQSDRADLVQMFHQAYAINPDFRIHVEQIDPQPLPDGKDLPQYWVVTYKEFQAGAQNSAPHNGRITSATFDVQNSRIQWVRLHETWLPEAEVEAFDHVQLSKRPVT